MKIVHLVTQMEAGGAQRVALLLADGQRRLGHEVEVWFLYVKRPIFMDEPHIRVVSERRPQTWAIYGKILARLMSLLRVHRPDVLVSHTHYANVLGQFCARGVGIEHRIAVQHNPAEAYPRLGRWGDWLLGSLGFYTANVAVSDTVVQSLRGYPRAYRRRLTKVYNGVPFSQLTHPPTQTRAKWNLPLTAPLLINVGRLSKPKNQTTLIIGMLHLPGVHVAIVGEGELRSELEGLIGSLGISERVHLLGEMSWTEVRNLLAAADIFVFPSKSEAMPMALCEAMSVGLPIVAGNIPAVREVLGVADGVPAGLLFDPERTDELVDQVSAVLRSDALKQELKVRANGRIKRFGLDRMVDEYARLIN